MKRTWVRFEAVMKQGSEGEMAALPPGNPEGEKRGPGAVKRSTKPCSGESQSEKHDEARDSPRMRGKLALPIGMSLQPWITPAHAGKTCQSTRRIFSTRDHPRVCGEIPQLFYVLSLSHHLSEISDSISTSVFSISKQSKKSFG